MIDQLAESLQGLKFSTNDDLNTLYRRFEDVAEFLTINRYPLPGSNFLVELFIGLQQKEIETMVKPFLTNVKYVNPWQPTIMVSKGYFLNGRASREEVRDYADQEIIIHKWVNWLNTIGLPWLSKHHHLPNLFDFCMKNQRLPQHPLSGKLRLLAIAKVTDYPAITEFYHQLHQEMHRQNLPESYIEQFELMAYNIGIN